MQLLINAFIELLNIPHPPSLVIVIISPIPHINQCGELIPGRFLKAILFVRFSGLDDMTTTRQTGIAINIILLHKPCTRSFFCGQGLAHKLGTMMINSDDSFVPLLIPNPQEQPRQLYAEYTQAWRH